PLRALLRHSRPVRSKRDCSRPRARRLRHAGLTSRAKTSTHRRRLPISPRAAATMTCLTKTMNPTLYSLELRGRITKRIPIAGVRAEHWDAPLAGSIAEFEDGAAQGLISGAPGHRGGRGAHAPAPTHRPDAPPA